MSPHRWCKRRPFLEGCSWCRRPPGTFLVWQTAASNPDIFRTTPAAFHPHLRHWPVSEPTRSYSSAFRSLCGRWNRNTAATDCVIVLVFDIDLGGGEEGGGGDLQRSTTLIMNCSGWDLDGLLLLPNLSINLTWIGPQLETFFFCIQHLKCFIFFFFFFCPFAGVVLSVQVESRWNAFYRLFIDAMPFGLMFGYCHGNCPFDRNIQSGLCHSSHSNVIINVNCSWSSYFEVPSVQRGWQQHSFLLPFKVALKAVRSGCAFFTRIFHR